MIQLAQVFISSGVNIEGDPFCHVECHGADVELHGQLAPDEVRQMALAWLQAAEAAEQDAIVYGILTQSVDMDPADAAQFIFQMRQARGNEPVPVTNESAGQGQESSS